ncbi:MAG: reductive dehalogenase [Bacteroidales bacterium]|nr:reductive dehalogenase [Bacteroidales bacterium]
MLDIVFFLLLLTAIIAFAAFSWAGIVSVAEKEFRASQRFFILSLILPLPYVFLAFFEFDFQLLSGIIILILTYGSLMILLIPAGKNKSYTSPVPSGRIDERDTMFSRNELVPGTESFEKYYNRKPEMREADDNFRAKAGLLQPGASQYHPVHFASADASFETIGALKDKVDGPVNKTIVKTSPEEISNYIKSWSKKLGAVDCGIAELEDYHLYSVGGRKERRDKPVANTHKFAIAFTVEMDREMVAAAPSASIVMESGRQYLNSGVIALQVAAFIRNLGYEARAHIDGNYQVVCPLVARDAGLGEIGRMGLLMTPKLGPRVRISVVTTNLPLVINRPLNDYSVIDFCTICNKCAEACPGQAISLEPQQEINGVKRWQVKQEKCFTLWCSLGTDCGRCISVCPYSHPDNLLHNLVRAGNKNSSLFRKVALKLDDYFYGRKPPPAKMPEWMLTKSVPRTFRSGTNT